MSNIRTLLATRAMFAAYLITFYVLLVYANLVSGYEVKEMLTYLSLVCIGLGLAAVFSPAKLRYYLANNKGLYWAVLLTAFAMPFFYPLYEGSGSLDSNTLVVYIALAYIAFLGLVWLSTKLCELSPLANRQITILDFFFYAFVAAYVCFYVYIANAEFFASLASITWPTANANDLTVLLTPKTFFGIAVLLGIWAFVAIAMPIATMIWSNYYTKIFFIVAAISNVYYLKNKGIDIGETGELLNIAAIIVPMIHAVLSDFLRNSTGNYNGYFSPTRSHQIDNIEIQDSPFDKMFDSPFAQHNNGFTSTNHSSSINPIDGKFGMDSDYWYLSK